MNPWNRLARNRLSPNASPPSHVVFAGGVTGGHVFPALALARPLLERASVRMTFLGTGRIRERQWLRRERIEYVTIPSAAMSVSLGGFFLSAPKNLRGFAAALRFLREERADVVVGLGGYASAPSARAAITAGIPLILIEANARPGRANRWLAKGAACVCTAFESTGGAFSKAATVFHTGLPIRSIPKERCLGVDRRIVVLGGSGGAGGINEIVPKALFRARSLLGGWRITHQSGADQLAPTKRLYARLGLDADVHPFLVDLPRVLGESTLAISRAGGSTLAELAAAELPGVLIPFPDSAGNHQRHNAADFARRTGCPVVDEKEPGRRADALLAEELVSLVSDANRRETISHLLRGFARPLAAQAIAELILGRGVPAAVDSPTVPAGSARPAVPNAKK